MESKDQAEEQVIKINLNIFNTLLSIVAKHPYNEVYNIIDAAKINIYNLNPDLNKKQ